MTTISSNSMEGDLMGQVVLDMSMSLDGFVAGPNVDVQRPMGQAGDRLHDWMYRGRTEAAAKAFEEAAFRTTGSVVMGRRTFEVGEGPWGDDTFQVPCFVLAHEARAPLTKGAATFTFVTDGIERALEQASAAAGDKEVMVMGGAEIAQQFMKAGLLDELRLHLVPVLLGDGVRLFDHHGAGQVELEPTEVIAAPGVTHLRLRWGR
jgi:dihydrofolate reductase